MANFVKLVSSEAVKAFVGGCVVTGLGVAAHHWVSSDLEYKYFSKNSYLATSLGQQGLSISYQGKPLKNISVVDFTLYNGTNKQFNDVDLDFSIDDPKSQYTLVSGGIVTPSGVPESDVIQELPPKDDLEREFKIKTIPKEEEGGNFDAVFVFDGDVAPHMSVISLTDKASISKYGMWRDVAKGIFVVSIVIASYIALVLMLSYFAAPRSHRKMVERFIKYIEESSQKGMLESTDPCAITDAIKLYADYTRPKPIKIFSKIFPVQVFKY